MGSRKSQAFFKGVPGVLKRISQVRIYKDDYYNPKASNNHYYLYTCSVRRQGYGGHETTTPEGKENITNEKNKTVKQGYSFEKTKRRKNILYRGYMRHGRTLSPSGPVHLYHYVHESGDSCGGFPQSAVCLTDSFRQ